MVDARNELKAFENFKRKFKEIQKLENSEFQNPVH